MRTLLYTIIALLSLSTCDVSSEYHGKVDHNKGGLLTLNQYEVFSSIHPPSCFENSGVNIGIHAYETLLSYDSESNLLAPHLITSYESSVDNLSYTLELRDDVYFHDSECFKNGQGRLMTADDVLFCLKFLCSDSKLNVNKWLLCDQVVGGNAFFDAGKNPYKDELEGLEKLDDHRLKISLNKPNAEFLHLLAHYCTSIYPPELVKTYEDQVNERAVGTGPFMMKDLSRNQACVYQKHPRYWMRDKEGNSLPYLMGIKISFTQDEAAVARAISNHSIHVLNDIYQYTGNRQIDKTISAEGSGFEKRSSSGHETVYLSFLNDSGIFEDERVREAFSCAIDLQTLKSEGALYEDEVARHGLVPTGIQDYPYDKVGGLSYDPDRARELLAEAGFAGGGGFPVLNLQFRGDQRQIEMVQLIQNQLKEELGVAITLSTVQKDKHFERIENKEVQLWMDNWIGDYLSPYSFLYIMHSSNTPEGGQSYLNLYRYNDKSFDSIIEASATTKAKAERMELFAQADGQLIEDNAVMPIAYIKQVYYVNSGVKDLPGPFMGRYDLRRTYIEESL